MFTSIQKKILKDFADTSDEMFNKGIIRTDSFIGEIGEYYAAKHFSLRKTEKSTKSVDAFDSLNNRYQIKTTSGNSFRNNNLKLNEFDILIIVFLNKKFLPIKIKISNT
ncbi:MAG: hypothetical protein RI955_741, partial [Bacteroidota bacterium]